MLDGVSAIASGAPARDEHATVSGMCERAALAAAFLPSLADPPDVIDLPAK